MNVDQTLVTHPSTSFDMDFNRAVNGANYLFGKSVLLINFAKVCTAFVYVFPSVFGFWLANISLSLLSTVPL